MIRLINKYGPVKVMLVSIIVISLLLAMASCSSVRKSQSYHKATIDSTHLKKIDSSKTVTVDSGQLHKKDSTGVSKEKSKSTTDVIIYFDTTDRNPVINPEDYMPADTPDVSKIITPIKKRKSITVSLHASGTVDVDLGDDKPLRIEVRKTIDQDRSDSSSLRTTDSSFFHKKDSSNYQAIDSNALHKEVIDKASSKRKIGIPFLIAFPLAIIFFAFMIFALWRKLKKEVPG